MKTAKMIRISVENIRYFFLLGLMFVVSVGVNAQDVSNTSSDGNIWSYAKCVEYAKQNNIKLQQSQLTKKSGLVSLEAAKAQWFPTLQGAVSQNYTNYPRPADGMNKNSYNGSYGLSAGWTVWDGNSRTNTIKRTEIEDKVNDLAIEEIYNNLETEILTDYLEILYAYEAIDIANKSLEVSKMQMDRAQQLMKAGKMSKVDYSQLESQYQGDLYNVVSAKSTYDTKVMNLRRLLKLGINDDISVEKLSFTSQEVLQPLTAKDIIYNEAIAWMPAFKSNQLQAQANDLDVKIAKSGKMPKINLNGAIGTGNSSGTGYSFSNQLLNGLNEQIGVTMTVPILDNKSTKANVAKAQIAKLNTQLGYRDLENSLAQSIESTYIEAKNNQAKYATGVEQLKSAELTDELTNEQFKLGLVNTLDLLTTHNKLLNARLELLQSKYMAILSIKMLDYYQNKGIQLP